MSQQLLLLSTTAATPHTPSFQPVGQHWGCFTLTAVYGHSGEGHVYLGFFLNKSSTVLIYLCMHNSFENLLYIPGASAAEQRCSTAPETCACRHLEWHLRNQKLWNIKTRTKEISNSWRIISLAGSKSCFVQCFFCFFFSFLHFSMHRELHTLLAWMNGKCRNNCFTLLSGVSGHRILRCWFEWGMTHSASHCFYPISRSLFFLLSHTHSSDTKSESTAVNAQKIFVPTRQTLPRQTLRPFRWWEGNH